MEENIVWENDWANYMAMDEDGDWYEFLDKPECPCEMSHQDPNQWHSHSQHKYKEIKPTHKPYWEESLIERKEENNMKDNIIFVWENDWAEYMAMDYDGGWHEYGHEHIGDSNISAKRKEIIPIGSFDCKTSIIKRERNTEMKVKTIQIYETSDNSVFRDLKEAEEHQRLLNLASFLYNEDFASISHEYKLIKKELLKNKDKLKEILFNRKEQ